MTETKDEVSGLQVAVAVFLLCVGPAVFLGLPVILGALSDLRGFDAEQIGIIASAESIGIAVTALLSPVIVRWMSKRTAIMAGLIFLLVGNVLSCFIEGFTPFVAVRLLASIGCGITMPIVISVLGRSSNPERAFAWMTGMQIVVSALELFAFPLFAREFGIWSIYGTIGVLSLLALFVAGRLSLRSDRADGTDKPVPITSPQRYMLISILLFFSAIGVYWTFIERIGVAVPLSPEAVGSWLSISNVFALAGAILAPWMASRLGERKLLLFGLATAALVPIGLLGTPGVAGYVTDLNVFVFLWNSLMVVQMSAISRWDEHGTAVSLIPAAQGFGLALPPMAVGGLASATGFASVMMIASLFSAVAVCAAFLAYRGKKRQVALGVA